MVKPLLQRPFDLVCFLYFASHIPITLFVDAQAVLPDWLVLQQSKDMLQWHIKTNNDYLMADPPAWFKSFCYCEVSVQLLFFPFAAWAFLKGRNWIRLPLLVYSVHVATTMVPILFDMLASGKAGDKGLTLFFIYLPYLVVPLLMGIKCYLHEEPFGKPAPKAKRA